MFCRLCKSDEVTEFLNLGFTPPADAFLRKEQLREPETHYPLEVAQCRRCGMTQLTHVVSPEVLYRHDYPYESSTTTTGQQHWTEFARSACSDLQLRKGEMVVDIGSNVGTLLSKFKDQGMRVLGIDPASNIVRRAEANGIETINEFFNLDVARQIAGMRGRACLITGTNVFAHVDDLYAFMHAVDTLLTNGGVFVFEAPHFGNLIRELQYDTIYHEHLSYLSLGPLIRFFRRFDMDVFDVQQRDIHGGSFRVFVARHSDRRKPSDAVHALLDQELADGLTDETTLLNFAAQVQHHRQLLPAMLYDLKQDGARIAAVSAPAKGMTLLNCCRIGTELIDFVTEKAQLKIGRFTPGTHIPVLGDDALLEQQPDYALLLAWNFADEIMKNLTAYRERGGKFIIPIPEPRIV